MITNNKIPRTQLESDKGVNVIYRDFNDTAPYTGTTSVTIINSALIPANTITINDEIEIEARSERSSTSGTGNSYIYINTTNSLSGATVLGLYGVAGHRSNAIIRNIYVNNTNSVYLIGNVNTPTSKGISTANIWSKTNINWASNIYVLQAYQLADVNHSAYSSGIIIKRARL